MLPTYTGDVMTMPKTTQMDVTIKDGLYVLDRIKADTSTGAKVGTMDEYTKDLKHFLHRLPSPDGTFTYAEVEGFLRWYVEDFRRRKQGRTPVPGTMNRIKNSIRWYITHGVRIDALPPEMLAVRHKIRLAKKGTVIKNQKRKVNLTYEEYRWLRSKADRYHSLILWTLWETMRRPGEVLRVPWKDVDFDGRKIYFAETKGDNPGWSAIPRDLAEALRDWKRKQDSGNLVLSRRRCPPSEYVFAYYGGRPPSVNSLTKWLRKFAAHLDFPKVPTAHCFRGSAVTHAYYVEGVSLERIAQQGGWVGTTTINRRYLKDDLEGRVKWKNPETEDKAEPQPEPKPQGGLVEAIAKLIPLIGSLSPEGQQAAIEAVERQYGNGK
jgi:integrase